MGGENSRIKWPQQTAMGWWPDPYYNPDRPEPKTARGRKNRQLAIHGVRPVDDDGRPQKAHRPHYKPKYDHAGRLIPPPGQIPLEVREEIERLMDDPDISNIPIAKINKLIKENTRVWERIPATPLVIDFTNIKQPIFPSRAHPSHQTSLHPQRPLYAQVIAEVRQISDKRAIQDAHYWVKMDRGELPKDFNPYYPGTDRHNAFNARVTLIDDRPEDQNRRLLTPRRVRDRARKKAKKGLRLTDEEFDVLVDKPIEEWDLQELARGRPRDKSGRFTGASPSQYLQAEIRERIDEMFKKRVRGSMNMSTVSAVAMVQKLLDNEDLDDKGRPIVSASVKLDASKFLIEHLMGKPNQVVTEDISVKLQGILGAVMISPEVALTSGGVVDTGRMIASQRGVKKGHKDEALRQLESYIDVDIVNDDIDTNEDDPEYYPDNNNYSSYDEGN